jgi:hypothetical protein
VGSLTVTAATAGTAGLSSTGGAIVRFFRRRGHHCSDRVYRVYISMLSRVNSLQECQHRKVNKEKRRSGKE